MSSTHRQKLTNNCVAAQLEREKQAYLYYCALLRNDFKEVSRIAEMASHDKVLEVMLLGVNETMGEHNGTEAVQTH